MANDDLNQKVTEAIQGQLLAIMPEEDIRKRVDLVIESYFSSQTDRFGNTQPSAFSQQVKEVLNNQINTMLSEMIKQPDWKASLNESGELVIGATLQRMMQISPNHFRDAITMTIAKGYALDITRALSNALYSSGQHDLASKLQTEINNMMR